MLFSSIIKKADSTKHSPKTHFPLQPFDRWNGWEGILESGDWNYIFTESVYKYIFRTTYYKCEVLRFDELACEEIALSVTGETVLAVKKFCQKLEPEKRRIKISISAFVNTIANRWFLNFITRFYSDKNLEFTNDIDNFSSESFDVEKFMLRTEILSEIFECIKHLSEKSKLIILGVFFENKKLKKLAMQMQMEQHKAIYIKEQAEKKIADCMKSKGFS